MENKATVSNSALNLLEDISKSFNLQIRNSTCSFNMPMHVDLRRYEFKHSLIVIYTRNGGIVIMNWFITAVDSSSTCWEGCSNPLFLIIFSIF